MKEQNIISIIFSSNPNWNINRFYHLCFYFEDCCIMVRGDFGITFVSVDGKDLYIDYADITQIKIRDKTLVFVYKGDKAKIHKKVIRR